MEDQAVVDGTLVIDKHRAVNKIGHALHDKNPVFQAVTFCPRIVQYAQDLGITNPLVAQSMFIFKYARIGGAIAPHQDATFLYTEPISVTAFWFALDDATRSNACMWVIPGSHTQPLYTQFVADDNRSLSFTQEAPTFDESLFVPVEVPQGSLVIFHGKLVHKSEQNYSPHDRNAYTFHVISGATSYAPENWLQRPDFPSLDIWT